MPAEVAAGRHGAARRPHGQVGRGHGHGGQGGRRYIRGVYEETRKELEQPEGGDMQEVRRTMRMIAVSRDDDVTLRPPSCGACTPWPSAPWCPSPTWDTANSSRSSHADPLSF